MNPFAILNIVSAVMTTLPRIIAAVQQIMASDAAHTVESAVEELIGHVTPGAANSAALAPTAKPLV